MPGDVKVVVKPVEISIDKELAITFMGAASGDTKAEIEKSIKEANDQIKSLMQQGARLNLDEFPRYLPRVDKHISKKGGIELSFWQNNCRVAGYRGNACHIITTIAEGKLDNLDYYSYLVYATLPLNQLAKAVSSYVDKLSKGNRNVSKVITLLNLLGKKLILTNILSENISLTDGVKQTLRKKLEKLFLKQSIEAAIDLGADFLSQTVEARVAAEMTALKQKTASKKLVPLSTLASSTSTTEIHLRLSDAKQPPQKRSSIVMLHYATGESKTAKAISASQVAGAASAAVKYLPANALVSQLPAAQAAKKAKPEAKEVVLKTHHRRNTTMGKFGTLLSSPLDQPPKPIPVGPSPYNQTLSLGPLPAHRRRPTYG